MPIEALHSPFAEAVSLARFGAKSARAEKWRKLSTLSGFMRSCVHGLMNLVDTSRGVSETSEEARQFAESAEDESSIFLSDNFSTFSSSVGMISGVLTAVRAGTRMIKTLYDQSQTKQDRLKSCLYLAATVGLSVLSMTAICATAGSALVLVGSALEFTEARQEVKKIKNETLPQLEERLNRLKQKSEDEESRLNSYLKLLKESQDALAIEKDPQKITAIQLTIKRCEHGIVKHRSALEAELSKIMKTMRVKEKYEAKGRDLKLSQGVQVGAIAATTAAMVVPPLAGVVGTAVPTVVAGAVAVHHLAKGMIDQGGRLRNKYRDLKNARKSGGTLGREHRDSAHAKKYVGLLEKGIGKDRVESLAKLLSDTEALASQNKGTTAQRGRSSQVSRSHSIIGAERKKINLGPNVSPDETLC